MFSYLNLLSRAKHQLKVKDKSNPNMYQILIECLFVSTRLQSVAFIMFAFLNCLANNYSLR